MFKITTDEKAKEYLTKEFPDKDLQGITRAIIEEMPNSTKSNYGETDYQRAANYHKKVMKKEDVIDQRMLLAGGGRFKSLKQNSLISIKHASVTYLPMTKDTGLLVFPGQRKPRFVSNVELLREVEKGNIVECYLTRGKTTKLQRKKVSARERGVTDDFKRSAKYLREFFAKHKISTAKDVGSEVDGIATLIDDSVLRNYPNTREGLIIAVADYVSENLVDLDELLEASKSDEDTSEKMQLGTGTQFVSLKSQNGIVEKTVYLLYVDAEKDRFIVAPFYAINSGDKIALAILSTAALVATTALISMLVPPVGLAIAASASAIGTAASALPGSFMVATAVTAAAEGSLVAGAIAASPITSAVIALNVSTNLAVAMGTAEQDKNVEDSDCFELELFDKDLDIVLLSRKSEFDTTMCAPAVSMSRKAFEKTIADGVLFTDEDMQRKLKYM